MDSDEFEADAQPDKQEFAEMRSKPQFEVDLVRGDMTIGLTCSFLQEPPATNSEEYSECFHHFQPTTKKAGGSPLECTFFVCM